MDRHSNEPAGDVPFSAEERYELRRIARIFRDVTPEDVAEIKRFASGGKTMRMVGNFIAKFLLFLSGAVGVLAAIKQFFIKGGG